MIDILGGDESLFLNEIALSFDFIPKEIPYRENENHYIATCIKPLFNKISGRNLFIFGSPGIGKTLAVKSVFKELEETTDEVLSFYINCWKFNTSYKIVLELCSQLNYKWTQDKKTYELFKVILPQLNKKSIVICLDEIDKLKDINILYDLLEDVYYKTIILITNEKSWIYEIDARIKSRLLPELLQFRPYNLEETKGILKKRTDYALIPNVLQKDSFELIVDKTFNLRDIRSGLHLIKESALIAESKSSKKILQEHVKEAIKKLDEFKIRKSDDIEVKEKEILDLIKKNSGKTTTELFNLYKKGSYKTFRRKIDILTKGKLITTETVNRGGQGKVTIVNYGYKTLDEF